MSSATWVKNELEQRGVRYQELHHPEVYTAQAVAQMEHVSGHRVAKVVVVIADGRPVELILPASRRVRLDAVCQALRADSVRLATELEMERYFTDCEPGAIPAMRHWDNVEVLMDQTLRMEGDIIFQAGTHCDAVRMRFDDWFAMVRPTVDDFSEPMAGPRRRADDPWERWEREEDL